MNVEQTLTLKTEQGEVVVTVNAYGAESKAMVTITSPGHCWVGWADLVAVVRWCDAISSLVLRARPSTVSQLLSKLRRRKP